MSTVRVADPSQLDAVLNSLAPAPASVFVLFFGTEDETTQQSWCPDCVRADPKVRATLAALPDAVLVACPIDRTPWKDAEHPHLYRTRNDIRLTAIPTLFRWNKNTGFGKHPLVENECEDDAKLAAFVAP
ncbi:hypothetical protein THASP1DRAFT_29675 [Thamnocephalis sphaerospora]|uniref:Thioredoxin domain-containing protein n=1 Tax=Thamnocephalis sphaerospora TaxID=78915 RepID=A0A4P9XSY9_9FUNG|nr:hypothetical protein THASP1DRAFT_29675 [Thamnocephalis sphaerospora]|eukprot:RKP08520.1 hypothetical protein THASP1DRAFT_29675 [Thamnocephalis sphaerospora]